MAITDDIINLAARTKEDLDKLSDYQADTQLVWGVLRLWDRVGKTVKSVNIATGTAGDQKDLLQRYQDYYESEYLLKLPFQHVVTLFEAFLFDLLRLLLTDDPRRLTRQGKKIDVSEVIQTTDRGALIALIVDRELNEIQYDKISHWFVYLKGIVKIGSPTDAQVEQFAEIKASRDLLIHNSGIVNAIYLEKAGKRARRRLNERIDISPEYFQTSWSLARALVDTISSDVVNRLSK